MSLHTSFRSFGLRSHRNREINATIPGNTTYGATHLNHFIYTQTHTATHTLIKHTNKLCIRKEDNAPIHTHIHESYNVKCIQRTFC